MKICAGPGPEGSKPKPGRKLKLGPSLPSPKETLYSCPRDARNGRTRPPGTAGDGRLVIVRVELGVPRGVKVLNCERLGGQLYRRSPGEGREGPNFDFRPGFGFEPSGPGPAQIFMLQNLRWRAGFRF